MKVHILIASHGEYEDPWTRIEKVSLIGPAPLEALAAQLRETQAKTAVALEERVKDDLAWRAQHPQPLPSYVAAQAVERLRPVAWESVKGVKQTITAEMRAVRKAQEQAYSDAWDEMMEPIRAWQLLYKEWCDSWWVGRGLKPNYEVNVTWTIEEHDAIDS